MKIDAICVDERGTQATILVDLDYVQDTESLKIWIEEELYIWCMKGEKSFDRKNFVVVNWNELVKEMEEIYGPCD